MPRKKLVRIQEALTFPNIIQFDDTKAPKKLCEFLIGSPHTFLELGCGNGDYTIGLSKMFPNAKCIGVDIQGERIWNGAKQALDEKNENILFLRAGIEKITDYLPEHSIDEIWIPFPDPFPKKKRAKKRLTSERFLKMYQVLLKKNGKIHLKTDNENLFLWSRETIANYGAKILEENNPLPTELPETSPLAIQTNYEKRYRKQGKPIYSLSFTFSQT